MRLAVIAAALLWTLPVPCFGSEPEGVTMAPQVTVVDARDVYLSMTAVRRFRREGHNLDCYRVAFSRIDGMLHVGFLPKEQDPDRFYRWNENPCGNPFGYVVDDRGRIVRQYFMR